jgi:hypothetical protein
MKRCSRCRREKPATTEFFGVVRRNYDGLCCYCRMCKRIANRLMAETEEFRQKRREWAKSPEALAKRAEYRLRPGVLEKHRQHNRDYAKTPRGKLGRLIRTYVLRLRRCDPADEDRIMFLRRRITELNRERKRLDQKRRRRTTDVQL